MLLLTGGTWGEQSARRFGGCYGQLEDRGVKVIGWGKTHSSFVDARLADVTLDIAKLVLVRYYGRRDRRRRSSRQEVLILQLLLHPDGNSRSSGGGRRLSVAN